MATDLPQSQDTTGQANNISRLGIGASISLVGKVVGRGIDFLKQIALARLLSVEAFGLYALIWSLLRVVGILAPLGLQNGVIQFAMPFRLGDSGRFKDVVVRSLLLGLLVATFFSVLFWLAAPWLAENLFQDPDFVWASRLFALILPPMVGLRIAANATRISQRMQYAIYAEELLQSISALLLFVGLFLAGWQLSGAIWATILSFLLAFLLACYYLYQLFPNALRGQRVRAVSNKMLLAYSLPTALSGMFGVVVNRMDRLFIGYYLTTTDVGVYQAAAQFSIVFAVVLDGFNAIFSPMIADLYQNGRLDQLEEIFRVSTKWGIYVNAPFFLVIFFVPAALLEAVFGPAYLLGVTSLLILTIGQTINTGVGGVGRLLIMTGHQQAWFYSSGLMMILSILLNILLIPRWGIVGAAVATAVTIAMLFIVGLVQVRLLLNMWPYDARYRKGMVALLVAVGGLLLILRLLPMLSPWLLLVVATLSSCLFFWGTLLLLGLDEEDRTFFNTIWHRLHQKGKR
jgi:O-antigen/teichoic acid export membrane protein